MKKNFITKGLLAIFLFISSCLSPSFTRVSDNILKSPSQGYYISNIPFYPQKRYYCGPASLASILNFYGKNFSQDEIAEKVFEPKLTGTLIMDILLFARRNGFKGEVLQGNSDILKREISLGHPLIVFFNLGFKIHPVYHYAVLVGYDDLMKVFILYSGTTKNKIISYKDFYKKWGKAGCWVLLILPDGEEK